MTVFTFSILSHPIAGWHSLFLIRSQPLILLGFPYMWWVIFLLLFSRFSLSFYFFFIFLVFNVFTMMYLTMDLFEFILFGNHWASWMYRLVFIIKFVKFLLPFLKKKFWASPSSLFITSVTHMLVHLQVYYTSLKLCSFFFIIFFSIFHIV